MNTTTTYSALALALVSTTLTSCQSPAPTSATASPPSPTKQDVAYCENATKSFLSSQYGSDVSVPVRYFTPEFARLWIWACTSTEDGPGFFSADPILETQDDEPEMHRFGPGVIENDRIKVPVNYRFTFAGGRSFTKEFVFKKSGDKWLIEDIYTTGLEPGRRSEVAFLRKNQVTAQ